MRGGLVHKFTCKTLLLFEITDILQVICFADKGPRYKQYLDISQPFLDTIGWLVGWVTEKACDV